MATSTIPAAIDGLIKVLKSTTGLRNLTIFDGQPTNNTPKDYICVGWLDEGAAIIGTQTPASLGNLRRSETYDINCLASTFNGGTDMRVARDRAFLIFGIIEDAVRDNATLNGAVMFAEITNFNVTQMQTAEGATVDIEFSVSVSINRI